MNNDGLSSTQKNTTVLFSNYRDFHRVFKLFHKIIHLSHNTVHLLFAHFNEKKNKRCLPIGVWLSLNLSQSYTFSNRKLIEICMCLCALLLNKNQSSISNLHVTFLSFTIRSFIDFNYRMILFLLFQCWSEIIAFVVITSSSLSLSIFEYSGV